MLMAFVSFTKIQRQGFFGLWPNVVSQKKLCLQNDPKMKFYYDIGI